MIALQSLYGSVAIPRLVKRTGLCRISIVRVRMPHEVWHEMGRKGDQAFPSVYLTGDLGDVSRFWQSVSCEPWYNRISLHSAFVFNKTCLLLFSHLFLWPGKLSGTYYPSIPLVWTHRMRRYQMHRWRACIEANPSKCIPCVLYGDEAPIGGKRGERLVRQVLPMPCLASICEHLSPLFLSENIVWK